MLFLPWLIAWLVGGLLPGAIARLQVAHLSIAAPVEQPLVLRRLPRRRA